MECRQDNVKRTIETLQNKGLITFTQTEEKGKGRPLTLYHVNKRDSYVVVAQLSPEFTAKLVDRWQELENQVATPALPNFADPAEAAIAWANQYKEKSALQLEVKQIETQVAEDKPYTNLGKIIGMTDATILIGHYSTILQNDHNVKIGQNRLFMWMRENGYLCKDTHQKNRPTQRSMEMGLFKFTERPIPTNHGIVIEFTPRLTCKGLDLI